MSSQGEKGNYCSRKLCNPQLPKKTSATPRRSPQVQPVERDLKATASSLNDKRLAKEAPLTEKNLKAHTKESMAKQKATPKSAGAESVGTAPITTTSSSNSTTTTTDKIFGPQLSRNGVVFGLSNPKSPVDLSGFEEYIDRDRDSSSPDSQAFRTFKTEIDSGDNEYTRQNNIWPLLAKPTSKTGTEGYHTNFNYQWTAVNSLNNSSVASLGDAKPDISESLRSNQYPLEVVEALGGALVPTQYGAAMPKICVEWKGPEGSLRQAEVQCAYDGALMVEAAQKANEFVGKPDAEFFDHTQALTIAINGEDMRLYINHATLTDSGVQYHQYQVRANVPIGSKTQFKTTYKHVRNAQDWAGERAVKTRDELVTYVRQSKRPRALDTAQALIDDADPNPVATKPHTAPAGSTGEQRERTKRARKCNKGHETRCL